MYSEVDSIVHNALLEGNDIAIPELGSLICSSTPSSMESSSRILPPHKKVSFSGEQRGESLDLLIARIAGVDPARGMSIMKEWLRHATRNSKSVVIPGVGRIFEKQFVPSPEFEKKLNPMTPIVLKKVRNKVWAILGAVLAAVIVGTVVWLSIPSSEPVIEMPEREKPLPAQDTLATFDTLKDPLIVEDTVEIASAAETPAIEKDSVASVPVQKAEEAAKDIVPVKEEAKEPVPAPTEVKEKTEEPKAAEPEKAEPKKEAPKKEERTVSNDGVLNLTPGCSYGVLGVFSNADNARSYLRTVKNRDAEASCLIFRFGNKFMLSACDAGSRDECIRKVTALKQRNSAYKEVWVYTSPKR